jgi:hypothetical protein
VKKQLLIAIAVIGVASLFTVFGVGSASAGEAECSGTNGYTYNLCFWHDGSYSGTIYAWAQGTGGAGVHQCQSDTWCFIGSAANDQASSYDNYRQHIAWAGRDWVNGGPGSAQACLPVMTGDPHLGSDAWPGGNYYAANDSISSFYLSYAATLCPGGSQFIYLG